MQRFVAGNPCPVGRQASHLLRVEHIYPFDTGPDQVGDHS